MAARTVPFRRPASSQKQPWHRRVWYWLLHPSVTWGGGRNDGSRTRSANRPAWGERVLHWARHPTARWKQTADYPPPPAPQRRAEVRTFRGRAF